MIFNSTKDLVDKLRITQPTVIKWRKMGMPFSKTGPSSYRYDFKRVLIWLRKNPKYQIWIDQLKKDGKI